MSEHLVVVFPPLLDIDHYNLLKPECELYKIIPFEQAIELSVGPADPNLTEVKPVAELYIRYYSSVSSHILETRKSDPTIPNDQKAV